MQWLIFAYSLPSQASSSPRVAVWRRLRRLGAITIAGVYLLPARDECIEAFQWLAQELQHAHGETLLIQTAQVNGLTDQQVIAYFQAARKAEYDELNDQAAALAQQVSDALEPAERDRLHEALAKLRRRHAEIARVDYFHCPTGTQVAAQLTRLSEALTVKKAPPVQIPAASIATYRTARWVTRPRPHVDRLACAWLIRRFINPEATIRYATQPEPHEVAFDMPEAQFGHHGNFCTFETMLHAFNLTEPALQTLGEIVHEIDLHDGRYVHPQVDGIDAILRGWLLEDIPDTEREQRGIALFEGLYLTLTTTATSQYDTGEGGHV